MHSKCIFGAETGIKGTKKCTTVVNNDFSSNIFNIIDLDVVAPRRGFIIVDRITENAVDMLKKLF